MLVGVLDEGLVGWLVGWLRGLGWVGYFGVALDFFTGSLVRSFWTMFVGFCATGSWRRWECGSVMFVRGDR